MPQCPSPRYFHACATHKSAFVRFFSFFSFFLLRFFLIQNMFLCYFITKYILGGKNTNDSCFKDLHIYSRERAELASTTGSPFIVEKEDKVKATAPLSSSKHKPSKVSFYIFLLYLVIDEYFKKGIEARKIRLKCHFNQEIRVIAVDRGIPYPGLMERLQSEYNAQICLKYPVSSPPPPPQNHNPNDTLFQRMRKVI